MKSYLLIDGHNLAFRAYHLIKAKGTPPDTLANETIFIFLNSFLSYFKMGEFDEVVFAWDHKLDGDAETSNFRKTIVEYKENRDHSSDTAIFKIIDELIEITKKLGCSNIMSNHLEADDIIYYISKNKLGKKFVVSSDKDLLQIVDENTSVYSPTKKIVYNTDNFEQLIGMTPVEFVKYKAILGDTSDNISGVPKYGTKKAHKLAKNWENNPLSEEELKIVARNMELMDLSVAHSFVPATEYESFENQLANKSEFQNETIKALFREKGYKKFLFNFHEWEKLETSSLTMWDHLL